MMIIARFIDGPLAGNEKEIDDSVQSIQVQIGDEPDQYGWPGSHVHYVGYATEWPGPVRLFRLEDGLQQRIKDAAIRGSGRHNWGWERPVSDVLDLTEADREMLRGMKISV